MSLSPDDLRQAAANALRTAIPGLKSVEVHGGAFNKAELDRYGGLAPCIRVAITGMDKARRHGSGQIELPVQFSVVCITRDVARAGVGTVDKDVSCLALAAAVEMVAGGNSNRWGLSGVAAPDGVSARNMFAEQLDVQGIAMWQVNWTQAMLLGESADEAIGVFSQLWINGLPQEAAP